MNRHKIACPTPHGQCSGYVITLNKSRVGTHSSPHECWKCYSLYLLSKGYKQIGIREFSPPDGGPILLLPKKGNCGARLRGGKKAEQSTTATKALTHHHGPTSGCII